MMSNSESRCVKREGAGVLDRSQWVMIGPLAKQTLPVRPQKNYPWTSERERSRFMAVFAEPSLMCIGYGT
jgi:hypothetical protein